MPSATFNVATIESQAFNLHFDALWRRRRAESDAIPHVTFGPHPFFPERSPVSTANAEIVHLSRKHLEELPADDTLSDSSSMMLEHRSFCEQVVVAADQRDLQIKAIEERLCYREAEQKWNTLTDRAYDAEQKLMRAPAPDLAALQWKVERMREIAVDTATEPEDFDCLMSDIGRLMGGEASSRAPFRESAC